MLEEIYKKLKEIKRRTGITYKWTAKQVGVSERTLRRWLDEENQPHPVFLSKLEEVVDRLYDIMLKKAIID